MWAGAAWAERRGRGWSSRGCNRVGREDQQRMRAEAGGTGSRGRATGVVGRGMGGIRTGV